MKKYTHFVAWKQEEASLVEVMNRDRNMQSQNRSPSTERRVSHGYTQSQKIFGKTDPNIKSLILLLCRTIQGSDTGFILTHIFSHHPRGINEEAVILTQH